jgi:GT2 family glycosyltransferase
MKKVVFCIPGNNFSGRFLECWSNLVKQLPDMDVEWRLVRKYHPIVYRVRAECVKVALQQDYDYMMWIDSDVIFSPPQFKRLLDLDEDIVSGLYLTYKNSNVYDLSTKYACIDIDGNEMDRFETKSGLTEVRANGMGWMLVKKGVFESIQNPFDPIGAHGEDIAFQLKAKENGFKSIVDPTIVVGHEKTFVMR